MKVLDLIIYRFKMAARTKELYIYIIGFPLIFMLIYGSFAYTAYSKPETIDLGYMNLDNGASISIGDNNFTVYGGLEFKEYLSDLEYNATKIKIYRIHEFSDREEMRQQLLSLKIDAAVISPSNLSENLLEFAKSIAYPQLTGIIMRELQIAQEEGNYTMVNRYLSALNELNNFAPKKYKLTIKVLGDPTYSRATNVYEYMWRHLISYASKTAGKFLEKLTEYLEEKYNIDLSTSSGKWNESSMLSAINVEFDAIGAPGAARESFVKLYYSVLVPGQIMQTIILGAVSAIYLIGYDIEKGLLARLRLTKLKSSEYIGGTLISWGLVALFQSAIMIAVAAGLGYIRFNGNPINYLLAVLILVISGILSASISLLVISFVKPRIAGSMSLIILLIISLFIAGYFSVPNPGITEIMGRPITLLDFFPWRPGIIGLKLTLMLGDQTEPIRALPEIALLTLWTVVYGTLAVVTFNKYRLRGREA